MPIEVKELIIRTTLTEDETKSAESKSMPANADLIISECVEQVLKILKDKNER